MEFKKFDISKEIIKDLKRHSIVSPTEVQKKAIPHILEGKDVMVQSETGSGKTIGFAVPTIEMIEKDKGVQVLAIAPTRELAKQVAGEYKKFSKKKDLDVVTVYGGVSIKPQIRKVKFSEIVVGTPGRLLDLLRRGALDISKTKYFVIDEADRLMDMGFIDDIDAMIKYLPKQRQTMLFSATINKRVLNMAKRYLKNPVKILLENIIDEEVLSQYYYNVKRNKKISLLVHILKNKPMQKTLVFCRTKRSTRFVSRALRKNGINSDCINGDMSQHAREKVMRKFAKGKINVLVATDVASRGIHVEDISHVVNYDLPRDANTYTHRIGRTARQGREGTSILFLSHHDYSKMDKIMEEYREYIEKLEKPDFKSARIPRKRRRR